MQLSAKNISRISVITKREKPAVCETYTSDSPSKGPSDRISDDNPNICEMKFLAEIFTNSIGRSLRISWPEDEMSITIGFIDTR